VSESTGIEVRDVHFAYRIGTPVIDGLSLAPEPGAVSMLIGPNGAGKTTLLRLMLGVLKPDEGSVLLDGRRLHRLSAGRRAAAIAYVPQRGSVLFDFTVRQIVAMGRFRLRPVEGAVESALAACDLADRAGEVCGQLSVGQQQRVLLARAMAQAAGGGRAMFLDEPTSAMDLAYVHRTMAHLRRLAEGGLAVVAVVQDLNLAAAYADQVYLMAAGKLVASGPWSQVLQPSVLEPVYGVELLRYPAEGAGGDDRPLLGARLPSVRPWG